LARRGREGLKKKEKKNGELWEVRTLKGLFFFIIQNPLNLGNYKIVLEKGFEGLGKFFKFNRYSYKTRKIKSTLIISILLSFTRTTLSNFLKYLSICSSNLIPPKHSPTPPNSQTKP
jgi:hypothetical protein